MIVAFFLLLSKQEITKTSDRKSFFNKVKELQGDAIIDWLIVIEPKRFKLFGLD